MKKSLVLQLGLLVVILIISPAYLYSTTITHTYSLSDPIIEKQPDGKELVYFPGSYQIGQAGDPTLPALPISLLLPPGHIATGITITFNHNVILNQKVHLSPKQYPRQANSLSHGYQYNEQTYRSHAVYRGPEVEVKTHYLYGHSIALACFSPVEYIPANQDLSYYSEVQVTVTSELDIQAVVALKNYRYSEDIRRRISSLVDNFDQEITSYPCQMNEPKYDYLIITTQDFMDDYHPLIQFHNERGTKTQAISIEEIYQTMAGEDEAEKIRNYIIDEYNKNGISYVLLAGDADADPTGEMQVPIRYLYSEVLTGGQTINQTIPSDLYYSALDGNWNADGDEKWGEPDEGDLLPELNVARICADNSDEITAILNKIFMYQDRPVVKDAPRMLMVGELLYNDPLSYGADYLDLLTGEKNDNGYFTVGMAEDLNIRYLYDRNLGTWNKDELLQFLNSGFNIIHHAGHSNNGFNLRLQRQDIVNENFSQVDGINHLNPIIYSHGCNAAAIDKVNSFGGMDCIAEMMLEIDNFASAYIGNTRYGWFNEGQTEGPSLHLNREFINALYGEKVVTIGAAHTDSRIKSAPFVTAPDQWEPGALRWCFYGCNVLGDAAMAVWTNQINEFENVHYQLTSNGDFLNIQVQTGVPGATVAISHQGELIAKAVCDQLGNGVITLNNSVTASSVKLTGTGLNYKPFTKTIHLTPLPSAVEECPNIPNLEFQLKPAYPNPFNPRTNIEFSLSRTGHVKMDVFNLTGQKIKTICENTFLAGSHKQSWDGRDDYGRPLANGIYYIRLQSDVGIRLISCVLLK